MRDAAISTDSISVIDWNARSRGVFPFASGTERGMFFFTQ